MRLRGYSIKPSTGTEEYVDGADPEPAADNTAADSNLGMYINLLYTHRLIG